MGEGGLDEIQDASEAEGELGREEIRDAREDVSEVGEETIVIEEGGGIGIGVRVTSVTGSTGLEVTIS